MNAKEKNKEDLLHGARIATSETVSNNKFLEDTEKEWLELQSALADRVTPRRER